MSVASNSSVSGNDPSQLLRDERFLMGLRRDMLRFAELQLRDPAAAEDMTQEALAAAVSGQARFSGRAALKTWVFAILKNKIADHLRQRRRIVDAASLAREAADEADFDEHLFDRKGFWRPDEHPDDWGNPESTFAQHQFWAVFEICLTQLPDNTARVFMMREFLGFDTAEICRELGIATSNCHVILHRARMGLRLCLDQRWFGSEG
ncbi:sigma-70 family RNA polymerase sigma factor [Candidatus Competibacter phosphatis]|nr:sigma-70 family RNA polymerase sigma factor [Candidatus Competibacter phosphatis]